MTTASCSELEHLYDERDSVSDVIRDNEWEEAKNIRVRHEVHQMDGGSGDREVERLNAPHLTRKRIRDGEDRERDVPDLRCSQALSGYRRVHLA
jgi:hypothetical protein